MADTSLALSHRAHLRSQFHADVAAGSARPLVLPLDALGCLIIPLVYLCIPHTKRPWLYKMRFAVMAVMIGMNWNMMVRASSLNMACAYATGLAGAWGTLWGLTVLVWTRPQFEAARVERRRKRANGGLVRQDGEGNGHANGAVPGRPEKEEGLQEQTGHMSPDETVAAALDDGYEYYWQAYPADSSLSTRLDWVFDYMTAFRGSGWTTSIPSIPSFRRPEKPQSGEPVDLSSIPLSTKTGYARHLTIDSFLRSRLRGMALCYLILDIFMVTMRHDPYFILGPDHAPHPLPSYLTSLPHPILEIYRTVVALGIILPALYVIFSLGQLLQFYLSRIFPSTGCRGDLWQYPSVFGSFTSNVLDHGLAGFWGGWWHQTFREAFVAPTDWMIRKNILPQDKHHPVTQMVGSLVAFGQSSLLHAAGSWTCLPRETRPWSPPLFFIASLVGVLVQTGWTVMVGKELRERCPVWVRRGANLMFVLGWLHFTRWAFVDDLSRGAVWLFEPVPVSVVRMLGFGEAGDDRVWRWEADERPRFYVGRRWWESGIAI